MKNGLQYNEIEGILSDGTQYLYRGYMNAKGEKEGVGITTYNNGETCHGEYLGGKLNSIGKYEWSDGESYWG